MYLSRFVTRFGGEVYPEFPTGNGKIDLIVKYAGFTYGIEVKTYTDKPMYRKALKQAASYGKQLKLQEISLIFLLKTLMMKTGKNSKLIILMNNQALK